MAPTAISAFSNVIVGMIVKNEAEIIERCLASALPYADYLVVIDTGSTDGTQAKVQSFMADQTVEYTLLEQEWVNFAHNRNALLDELQEAVADLDWEANNTYFLLVDADMELSGDLGELTADCYMIKMGGGFEWWMPYLVRAELPWRYYGVTHEFLAADAPHTTENHQTFSIHHHGDGGTRPEKFTRDLALLEAEFEKNPNDPRTAFYLAQTYMDLQRFRPALDTYRRYLEIGTWDQEVYWAKYQIARLTDSMEDYLVAWSDRPGRAEAIAEVLKRLNARGARMAAFTLALEAPRTPTDDILFVHRNIEQFDLPMEIAVALWYGGDIEAARTIFRRLAEDETLDEVQRKQARDNLAF
jgi:tetratricopeptide (TPR) repeat protein